MTGLNEISRNVSILGLERVTELLRLMGNPQDGMKIIHVTGTNGKGSFSAMLASVLMHSGFYVGSFNSPALTGPEDSFWIDTNRIAPKLLDETLAYIAPFIEKMAEKPTEFEVLTAAAFVMFKRKKIDVAIIECGLGGDGDATNVIRSPLLSVITNVALDHTDRLGSTTAEIASHKAGIIKPGRPVLYGGTDEAARRVIEERAGELGSKMYAVDRTRLRVLSSTLNGTEIDFAGFGRMTVGLIGEYQPENAAAVITAVEILRGEGLEIPDWTVKMGVGDAEWPARFEILHRKPYVIFDGSHNPDGVALAARSIKRLFRSGRAVLLMGVMADKDYKKYPALLKESAEKIFTVKPLNPRSLSAEELASCFNEAGIKTHPCKSMQSAVSLAYSYADRHGLPLIAMGTLYMYAEFRAELKKLAGKK